MPYEVPPLVVAVRAVLVSGTPPVDVTVALLDHGVEVGAASLTLTDGYGEVAFEFWEHGVRRLKATAVATNPYGTGRGESREVGVIQLKGWDDFPERTPSAFMYTGSPSYWYTINWARHKEGAVWADRWQIVMSAPSVEVPVTGRYRPRIHVLLSPLDRVVLEVAGQRVIDFTAPSEWAPERRTWVTGSELSLSAGPVDVIYWVINADEFGSPGCTAVELLQVG